MCLACQHSALLSWPRTAERPDSSLSLRSSRPTRPCPLGRPDNSKHNESTTEALVRHKEPTGSLPKPAHSSTGRAVAWPDRGGSRPRTRPILAELLPELCRLLAGKQFGPGSAVRSPSIHEGARQRLLGGTCLGGHPSSNNIAAHQQADAKPAGSGFPAPVPPGSESASLCGCRANRSTWLRPSRLRERLSAADLSGTHRRHGLATVQQPPEERSCAQTAADAAAAVVLRRHFMQTRARLSRPSGSTGCGRRPAGWA